MPFYRHPLPQHAHQGIFPPDFECEVMDNFRLDDCWLIFPRESRDEAMLLQIDDAVDPPICVHISPL